MDEDCTSMPIGRAAVAAASAAAASCKGQRIDRHFLESSEWTLGLDEDFLPPLQLDKYQPAETLLDRHPAAAAKQVDEMETCGSTDIADHADVGEAVQDETQSVRSIQDNASCSSHLESIDRFFHPATQTVLQPSKRTRESSEELVEDPFNLAHLISRKRPRQTGNWQGQFSSLQSNHHSMDI
ncbi:hypothetical protein BCR37DRAFT_384719 [Protomyces lactucae-debilis]|uniref:Uncharacterized protein n=1 Tax=Protomyces lactucae-debilis TaxID=2754530 RepID=A0A1Y2ER65_PROLT|nr:uncharacterized protein BCR37DRAFT_384719 [Protomyces lactucae-debilis]ORY73676.1 hypothetical protein BCR37DRAFT_384719 [Protomyces lactucae-debilis]